MGMFDRIYCKYPLPDKEAQNLEFQTKDLECYMGEYEITKEGRLIEHYWRYEATPEEELPNKDAPKGSFQRLRGCIRRVKDSFEIRDQNWEGELNFYGDSHTGELLIIDPKTGIDTAHLGPAPEWFEYIAVFVKGTVTKITRV